VRNSLPAGKTLSIAAPSSFWYLKNFPIKAMSEVLDYIIYMTYDLHGQWDAGNKWTSPGCPTGNCLRHHVNETEVNLSLALITKAGVPSNKVVVGMPLYGRSFKMSQKGCTGPNCFFLGDHLNSQAAKGACTDTAGYISNVEIRAILNSNTNTDLYGTRMIKEIEDKAGDIVIYDDTEWVSWMKPKTSLLRGVEYLSGNFGGTSDWAIDLEYDFKDSGKGQEYDLDAGEEKTACDYSRTFKDLEDLKNNAGGLSLFCRQVYALQVLEKMLDDLYAEYKRVDNGYDSKFKAYVRYINRITPYAIKNYMSKGLVCKFSLTMY
jgi:GH18 family chitinase